MLRKALYIIIFSLSTSVVALANEKEPNALSAAEKEAGWRLLWDGETTKGWRSIRSLGFPEKANGWEIKDGMLIINAKAGVGDIMTEEKFSDFELKLDFKMTPRANSGIKIFVESKPGQEKVAPLGPEFQILDDERHPDSDRGKNGNRKLGSLYDLIPAPKDKRAMPMGEWNQAHIISKGKKVTFKLNGEITAEFIRGSHEWKEMVADSKYKKHESFGEAESGHILLQDHNDLVYFRSIKILAE